MPLRRQRFFPASCFLVVALLQACTSPSARIHSLARSEQYVGSVVRADGFDHQVFANQLPADSASDPSPALHVYLEGDGVPWQYRHVIMPDPTPLYPLMLQLMSTDAAPSVYVGRPCYNGFSQEPGCEHALWTSARYSNTVVSSMAEVIGVLQRRYRAQDLWLIGHSGGGALAMLLARRLPAVSHVITLAGNLDTAAWAYHHDYTPLYDSLNPAREPALPARVRQWHLLGGEDRKIPSTLVREFIAEQPSAIAIEVPGFTHSCCWDRLWPALLGSVQAQRPDDVPGSVIHRGAKAPLRGASAPDSR